MNRLPLNQSTFQSKALIQGFVVVFFFLVIQSISYTQLIDISNYVSIETNHTGGFLGAGVSLVDYNNDGFDDLSFSHHQGNFRFYLGNGQNEFTLDPLLIDNDGAEAKGICWIDFDNDGDLDLFVTNRLAPNKVWRNDNGVFTDISSFCGIDQSNETRSYGMSFGDYNNDGFIDFYISNYHTWIDAKENELYMNNGDGTFTNTTEIASVGNGFQQSFQSSWIDINDDGWLDLHVINDRLDMLNAFYINNGDGTFTDQADILGVDIGIYAMCTSFNDFDRDGDMDLYVTNGFEGNVLFENQINETGNFFNVTENYNASVNMLCWGAEWIDYDNDMWSDLYICNGFTNYTDYPGILDLFPELDNVLFTNLGQAPFMTYGNELIDTPQHSFACAQADFNNDGFPDLVSHKVGEYASMLMGTPNNNNWLKVKLNGIISNRNGIGCRIQVNILVEGEDGLLTENSTMQELHDVVFSGDNYMSQNSYWQIFGLGDSDHVENVIVTWSTGIEEEFGSFDVNQSIVLTETTGNSINDGGNEDPCEEFVYGCTYTKACNYSSDATFDDGTCEFSCLCGEGTVWDVQLAKCIGEITCPTDVNQSGSTEVGDLLLILASYGTECSE